MKTAHGHLSYCSNIHPGEIWEEHFANLQATVPKVKQEVCPDHAMGLGLRIANQASIDLSKDSNKLAALKSWLAQEDIYIFTLNGFPYGGFHNTIVKDQVHAPDWTTQDRVNYTRRLIDLLVQLLPSDQHEGGISTSPLSYKFWWDNRGSAISQATMELLKLVPYLAQTEQKTGKWIHIDIEPEPDGLLENHREFVDWYTDILIPYAITASIPEDWVRRHIHICFDVCHYGVSFDKPSTCLQELAEKNISIGKIQISSALRVDLRQDANARIEALKQYEEPTYLHQVKALKKDGNYEQFKDLGEALVLYKDGIYDEWRVHFHVPLFLDSYGLLNSTQAEIAETLAYHQQHHVTRMMEIETYTWGVLPSEYQESIETSIAREVSYIQDLLCKKP
ncbi:metabolite traffic protein EboE [Aquirufa sp. TARAVU-A1A]